MGKEPDIKSYSEFWPFYLSQHSQARTRHWHVVGMLVALSAAAFFASTGRSRWLLSCPFIGYAFAWYSHFFVEKNRPATWRYPVWSFLSEFRMVAMVLLGRL